MRIKSETVKCTLNPSGRSLSSHKFPEMSFDSTVITNNAFVHRAPLLINTEKLMICTDLGEWDAIQME